MITKKICVLGATGFIGKHLVRALHQKPYSVFALGRKDADLELQSSVEKLTNLPLFDCIFHLPACHGAGMWPQQHQGEIYEKNVAMNHNVFAWWRKHQPQAKMICCVSSCSYSESNQPLKESDYWSGQLHGSVSIFGFTKKLMVSALDAYKNQYGMKGTGVVFGTVYGPGADFFSEKAHVVNALIGRFYRAVKNGAEEIEIWGDGTQTREFTYVDDQVISLISCMEKETPLLLNASYGKPVSIKELVYSIAEVTGYKGTIRFNDQKYKGVQNKVLDISLAKETIGWTVDPPITPLPEGIRESVEFLRTI